MHGHELSPDHQWVHHTTQHLQPLASFDQTLSDISIDFQIYFRTSSLLTNDLIRSAYFDHIGVTCGGIVELRIPVAPLVVRLTWSCTSSNKLWVFSSLEHYVLFLNFHFHILWYCLYIFEYFLVPCYTLNSSRPNKLLNYLRSRLLRYPHFS